MHTRLLGLLVVALIAASGAAAVGTARAERPLQTARPVYAHEPVARRTPKACPLPHRFRDAFEAAATDARLPLALLVAVAEVESNLEPHARSSAGARGLLQVMPATAAELRLDPDHVPSNVLAGARYLRQMVNRFRSTYLALAAYNAGPSAVAAANDAPSAAVRDYAATVTARWRALDGCR